jgi:hypothetical protein
MEHIWSQWHGNTITSPPVGGKFGMTVEFMVKSLGDVRVASVHPEISTRQKDKYQTTEYKLYTAIGKLRSQITRHKFSSRLIRGTSHEFALMADIDCTTGY